MRAVFVIPLLVQNCGGWVLPTSLRTYLRPSKSSEPHHQQNPERLRLKHRRGRGLMATSVDGNPPSGASSAEDAPDGGVNLVKARLSKPVGLVLAEKEIGLPGLVVDDMVEGSAKESGIIQAGMNLVSAGGVDCGGLVFDQVVELLQNSPAEEPIDFVFSSSAQAGSP